MSVFPAAAFFRFALGYAAVALGLAVSFRDNVLEDFLAAMGGDIDMPLYGLWAMVALVSLWALRTERRRGAAPGLAMRRLGLVFAGVLALHIGFTLVKTTMPQIVPYYADPSLTALDAWLHGDTDPWRVLEQLLGDRLLVRLTPLYQGPWLILAFLFPVILLAGDEEPRRVRRFLVLYTVAWIGMGNIVALMGMSVGPVFHDRFYDSTRFAALTRNLQDAGLDGTVMGALQQHLWSMYAAGREGFGTGLSAFPSVHVAVATVVALYCAERSLLLAIPAGLFAGTILILSVWSGYHYAVDGYASILLIAGLWVGLRRMARFRPPEAAQTRGWQPAADPAE